jgi:hypothetical protein
VGVGGCAGAWVALRPRGWVETLLLDPTLHAALGTLSTQANEAVQAYGQDLAQSLLPAGTNVTAMVALGQEAATWARRWVNGLDPPYGCPHTSPTRTSAGAILAPLAVQGLCVFGQSEAERAQTWWWLDGDGRAYIAAGAPGAALALPEQPDAGDVAMRAEEGTPADTTVPGPQLHGAVCAAQGVCSGSAYD